MIRESLDGKSKVKDAKEEEVKAVVVGEKEASGSGEKAAATGDLPCMDRLREELSCAVRAVLWLRFDRRPVIACFMDLENNLGGAFCADLPGDLLRAQHHALWPQVI